MKLLNEMTLIPQDYLTLKTALTPAEVAKVLKENTSSSMTLFWRPKESFYGCVDEGSFGITRVDPNNPNPFAPRMNGVIVPEEEGSRLDVRLNLSPFVKVFRGIWFVGLGFSVVAGLGVAVVRILAGKMDGLLFVVAPIMEMLIGFLLIYGGFRFGTPMSKRSLCEVLDGIEVERE